MTALKPVHTTEPFGLKVPVVPDAYIISRTAKTAVFMAGIEYDKNGLHLAEGEAETALVMIEDYLAKEFGGYGISFVSGGWFNQHTGQVIKEAGVRIEVVTDAADTRILDASRFIREILNQDTVLTVIHRNQTLYEVR
jgi:hypothetical protein